jgi:hypothetical protein
VGDRLLEAGARREIVWRDVAELRPHPKNSRTHSEQQIDEICRLIEVYGWTNPLLLDEGDMILAGHGRVRAALKRGDLQVPTLTLAGLSDEKKRALVIADNKVALNAGWDEVVLAAELLELKGLADVGEFDLDLLGFSSAEISALLDGPPDKGGGSLAAAFMVAPFSVLNAREGWWQERKRAWLEIGIKSELGRGGAGGADPFHGGGLATTGSEERYRQRGPAEPHQPLERGVPGGMPAALLKRNAAAKARKALAPGGSPAVTGYSAGGERLAPSGEEGDTGTSVFDPVLCEIAYRWFSPTEGTILDPFAGGSVRGIVAAKLGRRYCGIDLAAGQLEANREQARSVLSTEHDRVAWHHGDSLEIASILGAAEPFADMIFSCPPYADLEVYSDDPRDLSTMPYAAFLKTYRLIIARAAALLRPDRFACFVVGEVRDRKGAYLNFVGDTVEAFRAAGLAFYNEAILITSVGSLPIRAGKQFSASRKLGKTHQNVLVFLKGDAKRAVAACGAVEVDEALLDAAADPDDQFP